ncbi:MAG: hypothetical protein OXB84_03440 [Halobacteriovoraceae bacterium]|nr:hypothetical protein [Halobacteriovoraceae bacterium]
MFFFLGLFLIKNLTFSTAYAEEVHYFEELKDTFGEITEREYIMDHFSFNNTFNLYHSPAPVMFMLNGYCYDAENNESFADIQIKSYVRREVLSSVKNFFNESNNAEHSYNPITYRYYAQIHRMIDGKLRSISQELNEATQSFNKEFAEETVFFHEGHMMLYAIEVSYIWVIRNGEVFVLEKLINNKRILHVGGIADKRSQEETYCIYPFSQSADIDPFGLL